jgi:MoxR-like ATPase
MCLGEADCQPEPGRFIACTMSEAEKKVRLAEALRANLRKRKTQSREQAADAVAEGAQRVRTHSDAD